MINITKMGEIPKAKPEFKVICHYCSTEFECQRIDYKTKIIRTGIAIIQTERVECPLCGTKIDIDPTQKIVNKRRSK